MPEPQPQAGPEQDSWLPSLCLPLCPSQRNQQLVHSHWSEYQPQPGPKLPPGRMSQGLPSELPKRVISFLWLCLKSPQTEQLKTTQIYYLSFCTAWLDSLLRLSQADAHWWWQNSAPSVVEAMSPFFAACQPRAALSS